MKLVKTNTSSLITKSKLYQQITKKCQKLFTAKNQHEIKTSKNVLEDKIQTPINIISYPFGKFNGRVLNAVEKAGYMGGCTLGYNYPHSQSFPYAIFRRGVYLAEPFKLFKLKLQNNRLSHLDDVKQKFITFCSQGSIFLRYFKSV